MWFYLYLRSLNLLFTYVTAYILEMPKEYMPLVYSSNYMALFGSSVFVLQPRVCIRWDVKDNGDAVNAQGWSNVHFIDWFPVYEYKYKDISII